MKGDRTVDLKQTLKELIQGLSFEIQGVDRSFHHHLNAQRNGISIGETRNSHQIDRNGAQLSQGLNELVDSYQKTQHWIWYGLPTPPFIQGSNTNQAFALKPEGFQAYLQIPALLQNLLVTLSCLSYAIQNNSDGAQNVLDQDYQKAQSSIDYLSLAAEELSRPKNSQYDGFYLQLQDALANFQNALTDPLKASPDSFIKLYQQSKELFVSRLGDPMHRGSGSRPNTGSSVSMEVDSDEALEKGIAASLADLPEQEIRKQVQFDDGKLNSKLDELVSDSVKEPNNFMILPAIQKSDSYDINPFEPGFLSDDGDGLNNFTKIISSLDALELNQKFRTIMPLQIDRGHWNSLVIDFAKQGDGKYIIEATQIDPKGTPKQLKDALKAQFDSLVENELLGCEYEVLPEKEHASPAFQKPGDNIKCGPYVVATIASLWHQEERDIPVHEVIALKQAQIELIAQPMIKEQNTELASLLEEAKILEEKYEYKPADTGRQSRVYTDTKLYNIDNNPKASVRISNKPLREQKTVDGRSVSNNWRHQEIINIIAENLTKAVSKLDLQQVVNPEEFIRATIIFAQKYDGVGNAKDQTTGVRGDDLWRQNFGGTDLQDLFPLAQQFSYEYQKAAKFSGVFTGRTENLKETKSPIGARLKRIPEESVEGVIQMFQLKYDSRGV